MLNNRKFIFENKALIATSVATVSVMMNSAVGYAIVRGTVVASNLNVRSGPGTNYEIKAKVPRGGIVIVGKSNGKGWCEVTLDNGITGWASEQYIEKDEKEYKDGVVTASILNVRSGPGTNYEVSAKVEKGTMIKVGDSNEEGWCEVVLENGIIGWASEQYIEIKEEVKMKDGVVTASILNVRSGPGTNYEVNAKVEKGTVIKYGDSNEEGWCEVVLENGTTGWAMAKYIEIKEEIEEVKMKDGVVTASILNVRSGPGTNYEVNAKVEKGTMIKYGDSNEEGWCEVVLENGTTGWAMAKYIEPKMDDAHEKNLVTTIDATWLRKVDDWSAEKIVLLPKGAEAEYISRSIEWVKVKYEDKIGYLSADYVANIPNIENNNENEDENVQIELKKYKVTADSLNVRKAPDTTAEKVGSVKKGEIVEVSSIISGWAKIKFNDAEAYVSADYITAYDENEVVKTGEGKKVYLDPGHGGKDAGAVGKVYGTQEKDVALDVTKRVASKLRDKGYTVVESRTTDIYPSLTQRSNDANNSKANIFVSMHFNSATSTSAQGLETLYKMDERTSNVLADQIQKNLIAFTGLKDRGLKQRSDLSVLNRTTMPAALVEGGFLSNKDDEDLIKSALYREALANAIVEGIDGYFRVIG